MSVVKIDRKKLEKACAERKGGRVTFEDVRKQLGFRHLSSFSRWCGKDHERTDRFEDRLRKLAAYLDPEMPADSLLEDEIESDRAAIAALGREFWRRLGTAEPKPEELPDQVVHVTRVLADEVRRLQDKSALREIELVDQVFAAFNPEKYAKSLKVLEKKAERVRRMGRGRDSDFRSYRMSVRGLIKAAEKHGFRVPRRPDMSKHDLLSFVYAPGGREPDKIIICETVPERMFRFELAKFIAWRLTQTDPDLKRLLEEFGVDEPPPVGRFNFVDDEEAKKRLIRQQIIARLAAAIIVPYESLVTDIKEHGLDIMRLALKYGTSMEVVMRRVVAVAEIDPELPDFHFMKTDRAGTVMYKAGGHSTGVVDMPRGVGMCSRWVAVKAFDAPADQITSQISVFPKHKSMGKLSGSKFFCFAVAMNDEGPFGRGKRHSLALGCRAQQAKKFVVYARRWRGEQVKVGPACVICPRSDCDDRAVRNPSIEEDHAAVGDRAFFFVRKRRPWSVFVAADRNLMRKVVDPREAGRRKVRR